MSSEASVAVIIPTYRRPDHVRTCLDHLAKQSRRADRIVVIDASGDELTRDVVASFPEVTYLRNERGAGSTATSRAIGIAEVDVDVIAFLDDDAYAEPDWLERLVEPYADARVGGVGGRALNGRPGEENEGAGQIGMLLPNGTLTGNFAADPGRIIEVDHMLGANMSLRASALAAIGGIRDRYPGTCLREETDPALRVAAAGWRLVYEPRAVVRHVAGPYAKGKRFDVRYVYYGHRNHLVLLLSTLGLLDSRVRRYLRVAFGEVVGESARAARRLRSGELRALVSGPARSAAALGGIVSGLVAGLAAAFAERRAD